MTLLLNRVTVWPTWFLIVGVVALSSPPPPTIAGIVIAGLAIIMSAVIVTFALRIRSTARWPVAVQRAWHNAHHDRAALAEADAGDVMRMDSDKG